MRAQSLLGFLEFLQEFLQSLFLQNFPYLTNVKIPTCPQKYKLWDEKVIFFFEVEEAAGLRVSITAARTVGLDHRDFIKKRILVLILRSTVERLNDSIKWLRSVWRDLIGRYRIRLLGVSGFILIGNLLNNDRLISTVYPLFVITAFETWQKRGSVVSPQTGEEVIAEIIKRSPPQYASLMENGYAYDCPLEFLLSDKLS